MKTLVDFNALRFHVGRDITCPGCGRVMNVNDAVEETILNNGSETLECVCACSRCYDARIAPSRARRIAALKRILPGEISFAVIDGRNYSPAGDPLPPVTLGEPARFNTAQKVGGKPRLVNLTGRPFALTPSWQSKTEAPIPCFVYEHGNGMCYAVHAPSGIAICRGSSLDNAARNAGGILEQVGRKRVLAAFASSCRRTS